MDKRIFLVGLASLLILGIVAIATFLFSKPAGFRGTAYNEPYPPAPPIELTRSNGEVFRLDEQKGKIVLLFFGYTSCPDECPTTMAELKTVVDQLGENANGVEVLFVTVDPERDTPQRVQQYVEHFNPAFIGLSGSVEELQTIWNHYGVFREIVKAENSTVGYSVDHTLRVMLIDADGNMRLSYGLGTPAEDMVHDIRLLLK